ncbi:MSHA biogenesis protein MshP [Massilia aerilata]|uniref:MSHA biogenesis protein MshP n=1 Tax=Massilia aerilata TaxID=453817 RepID=A0ABW0RRA4_9BURK
MKLSRIPRRQGGFAYIAAVILLVIVSGMAIAVVRLNLTQAETGTGAALTARASQAARAGLEWAFYQIGKNKADGCVKRTLSDFKTDTGFLVTVSCRVTAYNEGQDPATGSPLVKNLYRVEALACNGSAASCPDDANSAQADYTERRRVATLCMPASGNGDCY